VKEKKEKLGAFGLLFCEWLASEICGNPATGSDWRVETSSRGCGTVEIENE